MADIGIDLGTATVLVYDSVKGLLIKEPSVVAVDASSGEVLKVGEEAFKMIGRTPDRIRALYPLKDGVISDFDQTEQMLRHFLKKASESTLSKPRVCICVPSGITGVESRACVNAAVSAGARKVYLIEEPVAAALGAGLDLSIPRGTLYPGYGWRHYRYCSAVSQRHCVQKVHQAGRPQAGRGHCALRPGGPECSHRGEDG